MKRVSYSQTGQDVLAQYLLKKHNVHSAYLDYKGTFVDVGACYPTRVSNFYFFYERGWRGLCIDANPDAAAAFERDRPEDKFVAVAIGEPAEAMTYYRYDNPQVNGFNDRYVEKAKRKGRFVDEIKIPVRGLSSVIDEYLPDTKIDFMSIDVEEKELYVVRSLDFERHRPSVIVMESHIPMLEAMSDPAVSHVVGAGYRLVCHTSHDAFLVDDR